jgi:predicted DNA-binding protein with PD1-like motif
VIVAESHRARRLVGRLDRGSDLLAQLADVCRTHRVRAGEVRAAGTVDDVVLGQRRLDGAFDLVTFVGVLGARDVTPSLHATVTLGRDDGSLVGGRLTAARVVACEFVIDVFDDVAGAAADAPVEKAPPMFDPPARTTWQDVVAASERRDEARADALGGATAAAPDGAAAAPADVEVHVRAGDFIDHPQFGRVAVERVDGDQEFVTARLRNQRLIRLSLEVLTLIPTGQENGRNLFRAVSGK